MLRFLSPRTCETWGALACLIAIDLRGRWRMRKGGVGGCTRACLIDRAPTDRPPVPLALFGNGSIAPATADESSSFPLENCGGGVYCECSAEKAFGKSFEPGKNRQVAAKPHPRLGRVRYPRRDGAAWQQTDQERGHMEQAQIGTQSQTP